MTRAYNKAIDQLTGLCTRSCEAGYVVNLFAGRIGLATRLPPQLGQIFWYT
ncbi:hypothetical protein AAKU64_000978 [Undibacterium sp. GrIS 1.8]